MKKTVLFLIIQMLTLPLLIGQQYQRLNSEFSKFLVELTRLNEGKVAEMPVDFFLNKEWSEGILYIPKQKPVTDIKIRYSVYSQQMFLLFDKDTLVIKDGRLLDSVKIGDACFLHTPYIKGKSKIKDSYFEQLTSTELKLLKHYRCEFVKGKKDVSSFEKQIPDHYKIKSHYYIQYPDQPAVAFTPGKKQIKKLFADKYTQILELINRKGFKYKDEDQLIELFNFYDSLKK